MGSRDSRQLGFWMSLLKEAQRREQDRLCPRTLSSECASGGRTPIYMAKFSFLQNGMPLPMLRLGNELG